MEIRSGHSELSVILQVYAVEGCPLSRVPLYIPKGGKKQTQKISIRILIIVSVGKLALLNLWQRPIKYLCFQTARGRRKASGIRELISRATHNTWYESEQVLKKIYSLKKKTK